MSGVNLDISSFSHYILDEASSPLAVIVTSLLSSNFIVRPHSSTTAQANTSPIYTQGLSCLSEPHSLILENFPQNKLEDSFLDLGPYLCLLQCFQQKIQALG